MTHQELVQKAREHLRLLDVRRSFGVDSNVFDQSRTVETTLVYLGSQTRGDYLQVLLNSETGEVITTEYHPQDGAKHEPDL